MLKSSLLAASLLILGASGALANQDWDAHHHRYYGHEDTWDSPDAFTGVNRYCGPGEIPQSFPDGAGVRCELPNGQGYRYY